MKELEKNFDPKSVEKRIYETWRQKGYFKPSDDREKETFTIVIPPPNVTGQLHMGHALDETLQDILIRYKRMKGYAALWVPGTDHAGIATQIKVEEYLRKNEHLTRYDLGREKFLDRVWEWKNKYGSRIIEQLETLGSSCDWDRLRFTMDDGLSSAVREVFNNLYEKGLIYRGYRIINWCPKCTTALSDAEVEYAEEEGHFWHIRYPVKGSGEYGRNVLVNCILPDAAIANSGNYANIITNSLVKSVSGGTQDSGVIIGNPKFVDEANGDYRLAATSPCREKGIVLDWMADATDLNGNPRLVNILGKVAADALPDLGCYECQVRGILPTVVTFK